MNDQDHANEWRRTKPDLAVYLPREENGHDAVNEHFLLGRYLPDAWLADCDPGARR